jgi:OmpA-OmpF porin, OOP family
VNEFAIDAARMETGGKGESKPVADNKIKEGKAANRRVEFTKL